MIKNLGQVSAIYVGKTAPRNANMIWLDNTVVPYVFKAYNGIEWAEIPTGAWIEAYVNGWLVSLQQGTVTADDDYMLINSGGVNYKMTVKDFVKSSVGNPLDFKGVIRTDADFPNPSTLESGDMYVIITDPAGGTVTDPYSKKTFSDSEKIVWDSVVNSWESLGKIDVSVDLSTTYSATEVTIHSSAGKETTVIGVTDDNAGVMVPVQKKWLDALSNGSTLTSQGPSTDPYHKHRYIDIVDRIISQQSTGESTTNPMSQKATTDALELKLDKDAVVQVSGVATDKIMSQKAVTDAISTAIGNVDLSDYLPLAGGTMTGNLNIANNKNISSYKKDGSLMNVAYINESDILVLGNVGLDVTISSSYSDLIHKKSTGEYKIWDASNLSNPATQNWVEGKGYLTSTSLDGYATQSWVTDQGYITGEDIPPIVVVNSGEGNAVTSIKATGHALSVTKGATYLTSDDLTDYATEAWVEGKNYLTSADLSTYATQRWVQDQGYITSSSLTGYATETWVEEKNYLVSSDLNGYATESWVNGKNYITSAALTGYATEEWVEAKNYITAADIPSVTITNSGNGNAVTAITANGHVLTVTKGATYLTSASLSGYATEKWVTDQSYLTEDSLRGYATEEWANSRFPSKGGTGATGTWTISITGNADTATDSTQLGGVAAASYATQQWVIDNFSAGGEASKLLLSDNAWSGTNTYKKNVVLDNNIKLVSSKTDGTSVNLIQEDSSDNLIIGNGSAVRIYGEGDLKHYKGSSSYTIYDTANLIDPATKQWVDEQGYITTDALSGYATESWVENKGYLTSTDLTSYATQDWVKQQNYLTSAGLDDYAKKADLSSYLPLSGGTTTGDIVIGNGFALKGNYTTGTAAINLISSTVGLNPKINVGSTSTRMILQTNANAISHLRGTTSYDVWDAYNLPNPVQTSDLESYATQKWVEDKGYLTSASLNGYATESWVEAKNYLTSSSLTDYATQAWVQQQNYLTSASLSGYATEAWVEDKNYLTSASLDGYAKTTDLASYLPLAGGSVTGSILLANSNVALRATLGSSNLHLVSITSAGVTLFGNNSYGMSLTTSNTDLVHVKGGSSYKIYDASNLIDPATMQWVDEQGYITTNELSGYATQSWVEGKNYLTSSSLDGYAKTTDLDAYLKRSGNDVASPVTGNIFFSNNVALKWMIPGESPSEVLKVDSSNVLRIGEGADISRIKIFGSSDLIHTKGSTDYKLWDASNISKPVSYNEGTANAVTTIYNRNLGVNGNQWTFLSATNASTTNIYAPTTAGTSGQVLQSQGAGKAPTWVDFSGGGVQLSDDNVWTGLNTFQGGLKTSDGTTSYDVWANDILTNPVKYDHSGSKYPLNYYDKTNGWSEITSLALTYITPNSKISLASGGTGSIGSGIDEAYSSIYVFETNTSEIYFDGSGSKVLKTNSAGALEYASTSNYAGFNSGNIRTAFARTSSGGGGGGGSTPEGGLTIGYYPANQKGNVTERAKIYCTTDNLYLKDIAKNTQLDFDTDGLYVTTGSTSKVRLATLNDVSGGGGSSVSLDSDNTWTGTNTFKSTVQMQSEDLTDAEGTQTCGYDIQMADLARTVNFKLEGHLDRDPIFRVGTYNFQPVSPYATLTVDSGLFTFQSGGSLTTKISGTKYEFWNKNNLTNAVKAVQDSIGYNLSFYNGTKWIELDTLAINELNPRGSNTIADGGSGYVGLYDSAYASAEIASITTKEIIPFDGKSMSSASTGTSTLGSSGNFFKAAYVGEVYTNTLRSTKISTKIGPDPGVTVEITDSGVYFTNTSGTRYKLTMEVVS